MYPISDLVKLMGVSDDRARIVLGVSGDSWHRFVDRGLSEAQAERFAVRAGFHPFEVWPAMADARVSEAEAVEQARVERRRRASREHAARKRAADPDKAKAVRRAHYQASAPYLRKLARARYWADPEKARVRLRAYRANKRGVSETQR